MTVWAGLDGPDQVGVTGVGSWPGGHELAAAQAVCEALGDVPAGAVGIPHIPELPGRGPGADMIGRAAAFLVDFPLDVQSYGWRVVPRPGQDTARAIRWWASDRDAFAEAAAGYAGPVKVQVVGPWTLAAALWLPRGERVLSDPGATRDLAASLTDGVTGLVAGLVTALPNSQLIVQIDEPGLSAVRHGQVPTLSTLGMTPAPDRGVMQHHLTAVQQAVRSAGADGVVLHSCATDVPWDVLTAGDWDAINLAMPTGAVPATYLDNLGEFLADGPRYWVGCDVPDGPGFAVFRRSFMQHIQQVGQDLRLVTVTPPCGLAGSTPDAAAATYQRLAGFAAECARAELHSG